MGYSPIIEINNLLMGIITDITNFIILVNLMNHV